MNRPSGLAFAPDGSLLVVDSLNHRVQRFTADGEFLAVGERKAKGRASSGCPGALPWTTEATCTCTDWRNDRVQKFDAGRLGSSPSSTGRTAAGFSRPNGLTVDRDGRIYVCDWWNDRVQVLDASGHVIDTLIGHSGTSKWARTFLDANPDIEEKLNAATQNIELKRRFYRPAAVTVSDDGLVFVADCYRHRVQIYRRL